MVTIKTTRYSHRFLARIVIEAKTPLAVGSGEKDITTDARVATDVNGLPYIPGTALAGVIRTFFVKGEASDSLLGYQNGNKGKGSELLFTEAKIMNSKGEVIDGLAPTAIENDRLLQAYKYLPIRQHARINEKGVVDTEGKFDEQVVFAGSRFCFELEMVSDGSNEADFMAACNTLSQKSFRIGGGTRAGFGEIAVVSLQTAVLNLSDSKQLASYLGKSSSLSSTNFWNNVTVQKPKTMKGVWREYQLQLTPDNFFLFSSGFGTPEADMNPVTCKQVTWSEVGTIQALKENLILLPATSIKGAIAHRVAYHYNKLKEIYADRLPSDSVNYIGGKNEAVCALFGSEGEKERGIMSGQKRGSILFSDLLEDIDESHFFNHVKIDQFTGGTIDGALFTEKSTYAKEKKFVVTLSVDKSALADDAIEAALEKSLKDVCSGMLPLGGGVNRGHGAFTGKLLKDGETIYESK